MKMDYKKLVLLLVVAIVLFLYGCGDNQGEVFPFQGEYPDVVTLELADEDGAPYSIEAIEGQVCVWFKKEVSYKTAKNRIEALGGEIVAQIPDCGYYLVRVMADQIHTFLDQISMLSNIEWAYPNLVSYPCAVNNYILDNFYSDRSNQDTTPHGLVVKFAMQECDNANSIKAFNIGAKNGKGMNIKKTTEWQIPMSSDNSVFAVHEISLSPDDGPIIINMSFGPYLRQRNDSIQYFWDSATIKEKKDYQERYLSSMRSYIEAVKPLQGRDFIVVKSAGNNGVKEFGAAIISYLRSNLYPDELEILDKHFILVTAGEEDRVDYYNKLVDFFKDKYYEAVNDGDQKQIIHYDTMWHKAQDYVRFVKTYSNEMEKGDYDPWVTKVDISDFKYKGKNKYGTSFAAPRAGCILSSVASEKDLTGAEVLQLAREVTKRDGELTMEALLKAAKVYKSSEYSQYGCLLYRLVFDEVVDEEKLELRNNCNYDIHVTGYLLNAIVPRGGYNTLDFDLVIKPNQTRFIEGFIENEVTITSVEKVEVYFSEEQIKRDLVGLVIRDPSPQSYFSKNWTWTIKPNEIIGLTISQESPTNDGYSVYATIHLKRRQMPVNVDVVIKYTKKRQFAMLTVKKIYFPSQTDYSSCVDIYMDYDFFPSLVVKNKCNMTLFVAGAYTEKGEMNRFAIELDPYQETAIGVGPAPESYSIHFAYKE